MLIDSSFKISVDAVTGFKLLTGEEILARVKSIDTDTIKIESPMVLTNSPQGVGLAPSIYMAHDDDNTATLYVSALIAHFKPSAEFAATYESSVSKLILPDTNILT